MRCYGLGWFANKYPRSYGRFWAFIFPAEHLHFEQEVIKWQQIKSLYLS